MKKRVAGLADVMGTGAIVRVKRKSIKAGNVDGFVVAISDKLLLLQIVDGNALTINGYCALRLRDISSWHVDESFVTRALRLLERRPKSPPDVDASNWPSLVASARKHYPLLSFQFERLYPGSCYIGKPIKQKKGSVQLLEVDTKGHWYSDESKYAFSDITQIVFGDGYTDALAGLVAHEDANRKFSAEGCLLRYRGIASPITEAKHVP